MMKTYIYIYRYLIELYLFLVAVHLYANYLAVKVLCLDTLNEDRLALIIKNYMINERIPEPKKLNKEESVFLLDNPSKILLQLYTFTIEKYVTNHEYYFQPKAYVGLILKLVFHL